MHGWATEVRTYQPGSLHQLTRPAAVLRHLRAALLRDLGIAGGRTCYRDRAPQHGDLVLVHCNSYVRRRLPVRYPADLLPGGTRRAPASDECCDRRNTSSRVGGDPPRRRRRRDCCCPLRARTARFWRPIHARGRPSALTTRLACIQPPPDRLAVGMAFNIEPAICPQTLFHLRLHQRLAEHANTFLRHPRPGTCQPCVTAPQVLSLTPRPSYRSFPS